MTQITKCLHINLPVYMGLNQYLMLKGIHNFHVNTKFEIPLPHPNPHLILNEKFPSLNPVSCIYFFFDLPSILRASQKIICIPISFIPVAYILIDPVPQYHRSFNFDLSSQTFHVQMTVFCFVLVLCNFNPCSLIDLTLLYHIHKTTLLSTVERPSSLPNAKFSMYMLFRPVLVRVVQLLPI